MEKKNGSLRRWGYLALGTLAMLLMGMLYAWSVMKAPLAQTFGWTNSQLALTYSICFCAFSFGNIVGSELLKRIRAGGVVLLSGVFIAAGYLLMARLQTPAIAALYLYYGVLVGSGTGLSYPIILNWVNAWFPDKPATSSGILMMGFGFSALVIGKPVSMLFPVEAIHGWRGAYMLVGLSSGAVLALLAAVMFRAGAGPKKQAAGSAGEGTGRDFTPQQMLRSGAFWKYTVYGTLFACLGNAAFSFAYDFSLSLGSTASFAATLVGLLSACNGMSRILTGVVYDKLGYSRTMRIGTLMGVSSCAVLILSVLLCSLPLGVLGLALTGLAYGYGPVANAATVRTFFGSKHYPINYSISNLRAIPCSFYSPLCAALLNVSGTFLAPFTLALGCTAVAFGVQLTIRKPGCPSR